MKKRSLLIAVFAMIAVAAMMLAGCGDKSGENSGDNTFEPDLAGTEWLVYMIRTDDSYIASAEYVFSEDRVKFLTLDNKYDLYTGEEAYTEALITEEEANAMYTEDSFGGDEKGGFITIIMPYENGGKDGLYGWMNTVEARSAAQHPRSTAHPAPGGEERAFCPQSCSSEPRPRAISSEVADH